MTRPDGLVDPYDAAEVAPVLDAALRAMGPGGLTDLLARLPGVTIEPARAKRFLSPALPGRVWLGPENCLTMTDPIVHQHVVGGVVLARDPLRAGTLPGVLARLIADHVREHGQADDAAVALSAVRDTTS